MNLLLNIGGRKSILNMFGRRRNNRGIMWSSLIGLGISAAAYGLTRSHNTNMLKPIKNMMNNMDMGKTTQQSMAGVMEFAKELTTNKNQYTNK